MAGMMDELISVLEKELTIYNELIPISDSKAAVIIANDVAALAEITEQEEIAVGNLKNLEKSRENIMNNMRIVLNVRSKEFKLTELIELMEKQPECRVKLIALKNGLKEVLSRLNDINMRNTKLIQESLKISEFQLNMIRSSRGYIGNNYNRRAGQFDYAGVMRVGSFDAKN